MNNVAMENERQYLQALERIKNEGTESDDRTGVGTISLFGDINMKFDLVNENGQYIVPILSTKKVNFDAIKHELIWMLSGSSQLKYLKENKVNIWDEWVLPGTHVFRELSYDERLALFEKHPTYQDTVDVMWCMKEDGRSLDFIQRVVSERMTGAGIPTKVLVDGDLGPVYGAQWREYPDTRTISPAEWAANPSGWEKRGFSVDFVSRCDKKLSISRKVDQIREIEHTLVHNKNSRRVILSAWNPAYVEEMALPPCHTLAQWKVTVKNGVNYLDCKLYMRSNDIFLGNPFNIVFYSLMTHMLCAVHGFTAGAFHLSIGDAHIYKNHINQVNTQLAREIKPDNAATISIKRNGEQSILDFTADQIVLEGYNHHPFIAAPVAV